MWPTWHVHNAGIARARITHAMLVRARARAPNPARLQALKDKSLMGVNVFSASDEYLDSRIYFRWGAGFGLILHCKCLVRHTHAVRLACGL